MFDLHGTECCFIHRRIIGAGRGFLGGGFGGAVGGFLGGGGGGPTIATRPKQTRGQCIKLGLAYNTGTERCESPAAVATVRQDTREDCRRRGLAFSTTRGQCEGGSGITTTVPVFDADPGFLSPAERSVSVGQAVMGRYGAGMVPNAVQAVRSDCTFGGTVRGLILGNDNLCYNKGQISNRERKWPRGRRPLLTGGEMRSISIAARAAGRLSRTTKRLEKIGMLKKRKGGGYA